MFFVPLILANVDVSIGKTHLNKTFHLSHLINCVIRNTSTTCHFFFTISKNVSYKIYTNIIETIRIDTNKQQNLEYHI